jgi:ABC-type Fe3+-hydroxamate transport system substrate-binding protein
MLLATCQANSLSDLLAIDPDVLVAMASGGKETTADLSSLDSITNSPHSQKYDFLSRSS